MDTLVYNETLGRKIRNGGWSEQAEGTPRLIRKAIESNQTEETSELVDHFLLEIRTIYDIYTQWFRDTKKYIVSKGLSEDQLLSLDNDIKKKLEPYHPMVNREREKVWDEIENTAKTCQNPNSPFTTKLGSLDRMVDIWRRLHDCNVDQISGLFHFVQTRFGERAVAEMYIDAVIGDWFAKRYQRFDVSKIEWSEASWLLNYLGFEGHRGHLSGSYRDGTLDWEEDDEKVTISFAPCGSGGRSMQGESRNPQPPLGGREIGWEEMKDAHDFTWGKKGICAYCAHCCVIHEVLPIKKFGYPVRVTHPPVAPLTSESRCSWVVYKDVRNIPEEFYTRVGAVKPSKDMPLGSAGEAERNAKSR